MIDCVGSGECVNVNFGLRERFAHAGKGARTIFKKNRELRCCEPRDLIERARDICRFQGKPLELTPKVLDLAWVGYFGEQKAEKAEAEREKAEAQRDLS